MKGHVAGAPRGSREAVLGAVIFQTDVLPLQGSSTEVVWEGDFLPIKDVKEINYRLAISILKNSPLGSHERNAGVDPPKARQAAKVKWATM